jgi:hypothetical protein
MRRTVSFVVVCVVLAFLAGLVFAAIHWVRGTSPPLYLFWVVPLCLLFLVVAVFATGLLLHYVLDVRPQKRRREAVSSDPVKE